MHQRSGGSNTARKRAVKAAVMFLLNRTSQALDTAAGWVMEFWNVASSVAWRSYTRNVVVQVRVVGVSLRCAGCVAPAVAECCEVTLRLVVGTGMLGWIDCLTAARFAAGYSKQPNT
jgi:hypothetical protein